MQGIKNGLKAVKFVLGWFVALGIVIYVTFEISAFWACLVYAGHCS